MSGWIQVHSGGRFFPLEPDLDDISITDIAHSLSMVCRYGGHCLRFYSVAEHCVLLSHTVDPEFARWALLHDAAEAYVGDMVRPLKYDMPAFMDVEENLETCIAAKFGLGWPMPAQVKEHDTRIVVDEKEQNLAPSLQPWPLLEGFLPLGVTLQCWSPEQAEAQFMSRYRQLFT